MAADPVTTFLGLIKPIVNDEAGEDLWGDKLNSNFDKIDYFASLQGALVEAPQDGLVYGRGTPTNWQEVVLKADHDVLAGDVTQNTNAILALSANKAPLGPNDGNIYGWRNTSWYQISGASFTIEWDQIVNKPTTYPPTLPIPSSGVSGLDTKQASQDAAIAAINWSSLSGKPATFPPTLPIPSSGVTGLDTKQASQDADIATRLQDAPNDGKQYARQSSAWSLVTGAVYVQDTPPAAALDSSLWWSSDDGVLSLKYNDGNSSQWVAVSSAGMGDAPADSKPYARRNNAWFDMSGYATQAWVTSQGYATQANVNAQLAGYLPLTGGSLSGALNGVTGNFSSTVQVNGAIPSSYAGYFNNTNGTGGGVLGYTSGGIYGICGYIGTYSFYGNAQIYAGGAIVSAGNVSGAVSIFNQANFPNNQIFAYQSDTMWTIPSNQHFQFAYSGATRFRIEVGIVRCLTDGGATLGASSYRWGQIYSTTATISTSDEKEKQDIRPLTDAEKRVAVALRGLIVCYRLKDQVEAKGDEARIHTGVIAQRVQEAFAAEGLDAARYGLWCSDPKVIYHPPVRDDTGIVEPEWEEDTGEVRLSIRYEELLSFIIGGL